MTFVERSEIAGQRMRAQRLWGDPFETPEDVVRWLVAMQAQEYPLAKWSVAQRAASVDDGGMNQAFADGAILRTHILRPTWHFVLPEDLRWLMALSGPRVNALNAYYYRQLELDDEVFAETNAVLAGALKSGVQLTRKELAEILDRAGISASGPRLGYIMIRAELDAVVCSGALRGKQHTYALFDERVPQTKGFDRDEALAELVRRYFTSRGPATLKDFLRWSSFTAADGRRGLEMVMSQLEHDAVDGRTYWFVSESNNSKRASKVVDLVQVYDESVMGYSESRDILHGMESIPPDMPIGMHPVLLGGRMIGRWRPKRSKTSVVVETSLDRPLDRAETRALDGAVERYGRFLGVPATQAPGAS